MPLPADSRASSSSCSPGCPFLCSDFGGFWTSAAFAGRGVALVGAPGEWACQRQPPWTADLGGSVAPASSAWPGWNGPSWLGDTDWPRTGHGRHAESEVRGRGATREERRHLSGHQRSWTPGHGHALPEQATPEEGPRATERRPRRAERWPAAACERGD